MRRARALAAPGARQCKAGAGMWARSFLLFRLDQPFFLQPLEDVIGLVLRNAPHLPQVGMQLAMQLVTVQWLKVQKTHDGIFWKKFTGGRAVFAHKNTHRVSILTR